MGEKPLQGQDTELDGIHFSSPNKIIQKIYLVSFVARVSFFLATRFLFLFFFFSSKLFPTRAQATYHQQQHLEKELIHQSFLPITNFYYL